VLAEAGAHAWIARGQSLAANPLTRGVAYECSYATSVIERARHAHECDVSLHRKPGAEVRRSWQLLRIVGRVGGDGLENLPGCALRQLGVREVCERKRDDRRCDPSVD
jgi:hypothetical protein